jgi:short-subunit dehydrogenase
MTNEPSRTATKAALITGASSGIGEAAARALASAGYRVAVVARREERLSHLVKTITTAGGEAIALTADLSEESATRHAAGAALDAFGQIDLLVNNVGFSPGAALEQMSRDDLRHIFEVNLLSSLQMTAELIPGMRERRAGRILNIGSIGGSIPAPLAVPYAATKAGLAAATRGLRLELSPWNIHVSLIVPGFVDTAVFDNARRGSESLRADPDNPYRQTFFDLDELAERNLRNALSPEDIARVIVRAATARRPRERYFAPFGARVQTTFMNLLPERVADAILTRLYKLDRYTTAG